jgi:2,3-dihydroxybenzoate-AMP ligase
MNKLVPYPPEFVTRYRDEGYWGTRTIGAELHATALAHPDVEALVTTERRLTYAELDARTDAIAQRLVEVGLRAGDIVMMQVGNTAETIESLYALIKMGAVPVCSLVPFGHHEIDAIATIVGARAHLVQADVPDRDLIAFAAEVREIVPTMELTLSIRGGEGRAYRIDDVEMLANTPDFGVTDPDALAVMQLSGGTTGTPKAIPRLHAEYWYNAKATAERFGYSVGDRVSHFLPAVHNAGLHAAVFAAHSVGATLVLAATWAPPQVLAMLRDERITFMATMTSLIPSVCDDPSFLDATRTLKRLSLAVPAVPRDLFERLEAHGTPAHQFFGMSEGFCCSVPIGAPIEMRRDTVGYPMSPADEIRLLDPETDHEVPAGESGELCVRGPYTLRGYYASDEHNAVAFTKDGFYRTGDIVSIVEIDGQPCVRVEGRQKDLISRGGEKINASEIENLLVQMPGIEGAALVGMADPRLGERACAFLVHAPKAGPALAQVREFLGARGVAKYKWPERLESIEALPMTPVGKVSKRELRDILAQRITNEER